MKRIAVFMGDISGEFQADVLKAVKEEAKKNNVQMIIYSNAGVYGANAFFTQGEKNIIHLPYLEDYDGVIVFGDTFGIDTMYEELAEILERDAKCPVVCLRQKDERFSNIMFDDYGAMCDMVEHFLVHHQFTRVCFMTGKLEMYDAQLRLLAYINTMRKYGINPTPEMIFEGDYWSNKGEEAIEWFLKDSDKQPQAIVCANDYMAIAVCNALNKRGIKIPEQICVSGFDDIEEARYSIPPITTVQIKCDEVGRAAFALLEELNETKEPKKDVSVAVQPVYRDSCCVKNDWDLGNVKNLLAEKEYIKQVFYTHTSMGIAFESEDNFVSLIRAAGAYISGRGYGQLFICLCEQEELEQEGSALQQRYSEKMVLKAIIENDECYFMEKSYNRRDLLPEEYLGSSDIVYVHPLHGQNKCLGYIVMKSDDPSRLRYFITRWVQEIGGALEKQVMYEESKELIELRRNYHKDALTGIGNRREMDRVLRHYSNILPFTQGFCIISVDMDDLKGINDNYGHSEGDEALCAMANILQGAAADKGVAARIGGDEYLVCLKTNNHEVVEGVINNIREKVDEYNLKSGKSWLLHASVGYAFCRNKNSILLSMQQADKNMYEEKRIWKNSGKKAQEQR